MDYENALNDFGYGKALNDLAENGLGFGKALNGLTCGTEVKLLASGNAANDLAYWKAGRKEDLRTSF